MNGTDQKSTLLEEDRTKAEINRILVVSRMTKYCGKAVHYGISLAKKYNADLYIMHVFHDPFIFGSWNLPIPSLEEEYEKSLKQTKKELDSIIGWEKRKSPGDIRIKEIIKEGKPTEEILKTVKEEKIDLLIMLAHEEGHLEHFLFGRSNETIVREMPCSVLLLKKEPEPVAF